ncbi:hypothetical protein BSKO_10017 [Bryopsis sp. KO-2023]|nr:hypothetical protein BSKO_10017 [Bryopsis sp. KO-2023]
MAAPTQSREAGKPDRTLKLYQVDAFTPALFEGNPAAVCPLREWLPDEVMQNIAAENNLAETAYFVETDEVPKYNLRWFTPTQEVDLCGHATLASAHVLFHHLGVAEDQVEFSSKGGALTVKQGENGFLWMDFPALPVAPLESTTETALLREGLGVERFAGLYSSTYDYLVELDGEDDVKGLNPDFAIIKKLKTRGVIVTAPGKKVDFVSRFFAPAAGIDEDPVTGSAHCVSAPFWGSKLNKTEVTAKQVSSRGGFIRCKISKDRVLIGGQAVTYMEGSIRY